MVPQVGQAFPDFTAPSTEGSFQLSALRGRKVVLYVYPRDNTPGCTTQGENFRDRHSDFVAAGAVVVGLSRDTPGSHQKFKAKYEFPFALVADPDETLVRQWELLKNKTMYGKPVTGVERTTYLIDAQGVLRQVWSAVKVPGHVDQVLEAARALG